MIFRDDDVNWMTNLDEFKRVHEPFDEYNQIHTIALLTRDIHRNWSLIEFINSKKNISVQVHCFEHIDFIHASDEEIHFQLSKSKEIITNLFREPKIFYPTFNSVDDRVIHIAKELGLETSYNKISVLYYIRNFKNIDDNTIINWHYWDFSEAMLIRAALKLYTESLKIKNGF